MYVVNTANTPSEQPLWVNCYWSPESLHSLSLLVSIHYLSLGTTRKCERDVGKESLPVVEPRPGFICAEQSTRWRVRSSGARGGNWSPHVRTRATPTISRRIFTGTFPLTSCSEENTRRLAALSCTMFWRHTPSIIPVTDIVRRRWGEKRDNIL